MWKRDIIELVFYLPSDPKVMQNVIITAFWPGTVTKYANAPKAKVEITRNTLDIISSFFPLDAIMPTGRAAKIPERSIEELANPENWFE